MRPPWLSTLELAPPDTEPTGDPDGTPTPPAADAAPGADPAPVPTPASLPVPVPVPDGWSGGVGRRGCGSFVVSTCDVGPRWSNARGSTKADTTAAMATTGTAAWASLRRRRSVVPRRRDCAMSSVHGRTGSTSAAAWSPDGTELAYKLTPPVNGTARRSEIWVSKPDGTDGRVITPSDASAHTPSWSPDGSRIAFRRVGTGTTGTGGQTEQVIGIFVADAKDGGHLTQLTTSDDIQPVWSPDGAHIVFASFRDGRSDLYVMRSDGSEQTRLTDASAYDQAPTWSPDGSTIMFDRDPDSRDPTGCSTLPDSPLWSSGAQACGGQPADAGPAPSALWTIAADGSELHQFTENAWSDFAASWIKA